MLVVDFEGVGDVDAEDLGCTDRGECDCFCAAATADVEDALSRARVHRCGLAAAADHRPGPVEIVAVVVASANYNSARLHPVALDQFGADDGSHDEVGVTDQVLKPSRPRVQIVTAASRSRTGSAFIEADRTPFVSSDDGLAAGVIRCGAAPHAPPGTMKPPIGSRLETVNIEQRALARS